MQRCVWNKKAKSKQSHRVQSSCGQQWTHTHAQHHFSSTQVWAGGYTDISSCLFLTQKITFQNQEQKRSHSPSCIFRTHTLCLVSFRIFSKYTPAKPLDTHAMSTAISPTNWPLVVWIFSLESSSFTEGHCGGSNTRKHPSAGAVWRVISITSVRTEHIQAADDWILPAPEWLQPWAGPARSTGWSPTFSPA